MKVAALCAGYGGLELAVGDVWPDAHLSWVAETDPHASQVLEHRFGVPNYGDLTAITDPPPVDIVTAGFPCQPFSTAGLRQGVNDERWLIDDVCRVASAAGASTLILENVTGLLTANDGDAMARVCAAMASHGFSRWEWTTLRAADVGACHRRERWFCVAQYADVQRLTSSSGRTQPASAHRHAQTAHDIGPVAGRTVAHADGVAAGRHRGTDARPQAGDDLGATQHDHRPADGARATAHAEGDEQRKLLEPVGERAELGRSNEGSVRHPDGTRLDRFGPYQPAVNRWADTLGRPAPDPLTDGRLNPRFVEWMMGLPAGWVCDVIDSRAKALHILGNGVVPQQAAAAIRQLIR